MGYRKILNLYKDIRILDFKECYALEKIHGTSASITYNEGDIKFFSGGAKHETFVELFDESILRGKFEQLGYPKVKVYGEAYGGKLQGMSGTYGKEMKFVAFEVQIGDVWVSVDNAYEITTKLCLEFVAFERGEATVNWINSQRYLPSSQAKRNGIEEDKMREGVVIRPIKEYRDYRGNRIITKHKRDEFKETKTKREVEPAQLKVLDDADKIAEEWVTPMRLNHILDKMPEKGEMKHVPLVIKAMIEDVQTESEKEVVWSKSVAQSIARVTVPMYKKKISSI